MHYLFLWEHRALKLLNSSERRTKIHNAIKLFRQNKPVNIAKRILLGGIIVLFPSLLIYFILGFNFSLITGLVLITVLEYFTVKQDIPYIRNILSTNE